MANLLDIRRRIKSVKNTQQITKAMKMVSAAKLKRAQERAVSARPFAVKMAEVLTDLASQAGEDFTHPFIDARGDERYLLVLVTADKGLAGAFNANLVKAAQAFIREHEGRSIEILAVGRKGRDFFRRRGSEIAGEYIGLTGKGRIEHAEALEIARDVMRRFTEDEGIDKVFVIFNEFRSVISQRVVVEQILPVSRAEEVGDEGDSPREQNLVGYKYEQPPVSEQILPPDRES